MLLSVVTLNYKKKDITLNCVKSILKTLGQELSEDEIEVIIIDNNSLDNSVLEIREEIRKNRAKSIFIHENAENAGFAGGCNYGATFARGEYLLFLNNDTVVKDKGILNMALFMKENPDATILGGALRNPDGSSQVSAGKFYTPLNALFLLLGFQNFGLIDKNPKRVAEVDWVKGAMLMIKKESFEKLGGFDSNIFMYAEDMELCYRAKKAGFKTFFYPEVEVIHEEQGSSNRAFAVVNIYKNLLYFYKKHRSAGEYLFLKLLLTVKAKVLIGYGRIARNSYLVSTYEQALEVIR